MKSVHISSLSEWRDGAAPGCWFIAEQTFYLLEGLDDSSSGNEDKSEASDDEWCVFVLFVNQIIQKQKWDMTITKVDQKTQALNWLRYSDCFKHDHFSTKFTTEIRRSPKKFTVLENLFAFLTSSYLLICFTCPIPIDLWILGYIWLVLFPLTVSLCIIKSLNCNCLPGCLL